MKYLPELLTDLWALGCYPDLIVQLLRPLLSDTAKIQALDLGCGKGAAAITLAREMGMHVTGVDACEPFIAEARKIAITHHVEKLCQFVLEDIRTYIKKNLTFDLIVYASLGPLLGDLGETISRLRRLVRTDGYILIDDGFLREVDHLERTGYAHMKSYAESVKLLLKCGDILTAEHQINAKQTAQINSNYLKSIRIQSKILIQRIPEIKKELESYINSQVEEKKIIESNVTECIWILQKKTID